MKRNYLPRGKDKFIEENYHDVIDRLMLQSQLVNGGNRQPSVHSIFYDKENLQTALYGIIGDESGLTNRRNQTRIATKPFVENQLVEIDEKFKNYCKSQLKQGRAKPTVWPLELLQERLKMEANLFILNEEIIEINRRLKLFAEKDKEISDKDILKFGPRGHARLQNSVLVEIDGMGVREHYVKKGEESILIIDETHQKAKPFNGFSVVDYRQYISTPWIQGCQKQAELNKQKAIKDGVKYELLTKGQKEGLNFPIPQFPDSCINYKKRVLERNTNK
jgi:hypothetical protein